MSFKSLLTYINERYPWHVWQMVHHPDVDGIVVVCDGRNLVTLESPLTFDEAEHLIALAYDYRFRHPVIWS